MDEVLTSISEVSTEQVAAHDRLAFWEAHNASALIGLRCSTFAPGGLNASERTFDLGSVRITEICGNEHVVERSPEMLRTYPKDSVFASVLLQGSAFFFQAGQCINASVGDVLVYSTDVPYLHGFAADMRLLVVEADVGDAGGTGAVGQPRPRSPIKVDTRLRSGRLLAGALTSTAVSFVQRPLAADVPRVAARTRSLLQALRSPDSRFELTDSAYWQLLRAEAYIAEHLQDPGLDADAVATMLGRSVRQLNRLFEARQNSVSQWIWQQRLTRAREDLASMELRSSSVSDIAHRWGFASHAHFTRAFKARYGLVPTAHRRGARR